MCEMRRDKDAGCVCQDDCHLPRPLNYTQTAAKKKTKNIVESVLKKRRGLPSKYCVLSVEVGARPESDEAAEGQTQKHCEYKKKQRFSNWMCEE